MKKDLINKMVEQFYQVPGEFQGKLGSAQIALVKYNNQYALVIDRYLDKNRRYRDYVDYETGQMIGLPVFVLFNSVKDIEKLKQVETIVDTSVYVNQKAQEMFSDSQIISKGNCDIETRYDTFILKDIKLKQFSKGTVLVVRVDSHNPGATSKTTNEIPARTYFQLKEDAMGLGTLVKGYALFFHGLMIAVSLYMIMSLGSSIIKESKRKKDLETKFKSIIKDGKDWKIYQVPDDAPNAFAIIRPNIFITDGIIKLVSEEELIAVMLHEAGHIKNFDSLKSTGSHMSIMLLFLGAMIRLPGWSAVIAYIIMMIMLSSQSYQYVRSRLLGRPAEYRADSFATKYGYGDQLISALNKLEEWMKKEQSKRPCGEICEKIRKLQEHLDDHPELKDRIESILKTKEAWEMASKKAFKQFKDFALNKLKGE